MVLQIVGFSTPYWRYKEDYGNAGLFKFCLPNVADIKICGEFTISDQPDWFKAVLSLESIAIILQILAALFLLAFHCKNESKDYAKACFFFLVMAGICGIIGVSIYGAKVENTDVIPLNWSFAFEIVGSGISLIVGLAASFSLVQQSGYLQLS
ncbi:hypothetical protein SNE40_021924 [Patella caerulea]